MQEKECDVVVGAFREFFQSFAETEKARDELAAQRQRDLLGFDMNLRPQKEAAPEQDALEAVRAEKKRAKKARQRAARVQAAAQRQPAQPEVGHFAFHPICLRK